MIKNSMYISDYLVFGYESNQTPDESKSKYLEYLQLLIDYLIELKECAEKTNTNKYPTLLFRELESKLVIFRKKLNAQKLAEWYHNVFYDLEKEIDELRRNNIK